MELTVIDTTSSTSNSNNSNPAAATTVVVATVNDAPPHPPHHPRIPTLSFMYTTEKMSSSTDDSEDLADPLNEELRNVLSVMHVTRENIDALIAKFANFQEPPSMYLEEYQELTSKLHELEIKEQELNEKLQLSGGGGSAAAAAAKTVGLAATTIDVDGGGILPSVGLLDEVSVCDVCAFRCIDKSINRIYTNIVYSELPWMRYVCVNGVWCNRGQGPIDRSTKHLYNLKKNKY